VQRAPLRTTAVGVQWVRELAPRPKGCFAYWAGSGRGRALGVFELCLLDGVSLTAIVGILDMEGALLKRPLAGCEASLTEILGAPPTEMVGMLDMDVALLKRPRPGDPVTEILGVSLTAIVGISDIDVGLLNRPLPATGDSLTEMLGTGGDGVSLIEMVGTAGIDIDPDFAKRLLVGDSLTEMLGTDGMVLATGALVREGSSYGFVAGATGVLEGRSYGFGGRSDVLTLRRGLEGRCVSGRLKRRAGELERPLKGDAADLLGGPSVLGVADLLGGASMPVSAADLLGGRSKPTSPAVAVGLGSGLGFTGSSMIDFSSFNSITL
jgi:hypothetical protein